MATCCCSPPTDSTVAIWKLSDKEAPERRLDDDDVIQQEHWTMVHSMRSVWRHDGPMETSLSVAAEQ
jgi:hypothetical protein